ncbi:MAG TPA: hypothetical protein VL221_06210 [Bacteroidota bacterium]|nr:hypothetical protein [Bacteroidota bacterium]
MKTPGDTPLEHPGAGLCSRCLHARAVTSTRGSTFIRCALAETDPRFPKYPPLPVHACAGFAPRPGAPGRAS